MASISPQLGSGIYRISDVSLYTGMPYATVRSWFRTATAVFESDYGKVRGTYSVSFYDLIDVLVARQFRTYGVTMSVVRRAYNRLKEDLRTKHPFCHRELYTDGRAIIINVGSALRAQSLHDAITRQRFFNEIKESLSRVTYAPSTDLAECWEVRSGVQINPAVCMGRPVISGTGVSTFVVCSAFHANNSNEVLVAKMYGIKPSEVLAAVHFEDSLKPAA